MDREQILQASADVISENVQAAPDEVARAIGITHEELRAHFPDRFSLVYALGKRGTDLMEAALDSARIDEGPADEALRRLVEESWRFAPFLAFLYGENTLHGPGELDDAFIRIGVRVTGLIQRGQKEGVFRDDLTAAWVSEVAWFLTAAATWNVRKRHLTTENGPANILAVLMSGTRAPAGA
ncbi:TetR/AcrR family transcriptional regulator [Nocardiopsis baichengensis]|uniref:TetR/AcrR family transcriptional regulator n=1 Tax=Nocardiopsis baichengensis TaxID=280240 RepID=UPI000348DBEA|nr:TetR/AcrR family transcriptional regulator [Nocardiopsis baichengensis]